MNIRKTVFAAAVASVVSLATSTLVSAGGCPYGYTDGAKPSRNLRERQLATAGSPANQYAEPHDTVDYEAVKKDIVTLLTDSKDWWPADFGNYGPFFIRLAWHCAGTYRLSDGRGGCDGARIRHLPERAWADNTNLDKALDLLTPLKLKYGHALSWGDLIALTGTTAIESMGGPKIGFCGGRVDDLDGSESIELDSSLPDAEVADCDDQGHCKEPFGATTTPGLIYVNPEGPNGNPDPLLSAIEIREAFKRMGFNDRETVALIGGGHGFGKMHGACMTGPGPNPIEAPEAPWPGTCSNNPGPMGKGNNTYTNGFEHAWTFAPTEWTNQYFQALANVPLEKDRSPGGKVTWKGIPDTNPPLRMLTVDVALSRDELYKPITLEFSTNITSLGEVFGAAWYKLMTMDMGPVARCRGNLVPSVQSHQNPLPPAPTPDKLPKFDEIRKRIQTLLNKDFQGLTSDKVDGTTYNGALFVHLAYQCASTFRITDYAGGCNGAKIRFSPQKDWYGNAGVDTVITALESIKSEFTTLSTADLIVLAGQVALEQGGSDPIPFVGGRVDALDGANVDHLAPRTYYKNPLVAVRDDAKVRGLTPYDYVALAGRPRSRAQQQRLGFNGTWSENPMTVSNEFFKVLVNNGWTKSCKNEFRAIGKDIYVLDTDVALLWDSTYKSIVQLFASDEGLFKKAFSEAWGKLMMADHFSTKEGYY